MSRADRVVKRNQEREKKKEEQKRVASQSTFEKNVSALLSINPNLASSIFGVQTNDRYEVFQGKDVVDINILDRERNLLFYENPPQAVTERFEELEDSNSLNPYIYIFGVGNGVLVKMLLGNEQHKRIAVVEPELELLYIAFNLIDFSREILERRVDFRLSKSVDFPATEMIISKDDARIYSKVYSLELNCNYYSQYQDEAIRVNQNFTKAINHIIIGHGNDATDSLIGIEHHIKNIPIMCQNAKFREFVKLRNSETAIIVSTGPSLAKQLPLLKEIAPYVTLISVDASLPILYEHNIKPDIVTSIERVALTAKFFERVPEEFQKDIVFVQASLQHEEVTRAIKGPRVLVMRPFRISRFFEMHEFGYVGLGMSSANMAHELAFLMGFKDVVLIGQDLAYGEAGESHSKGHTFGQDDAKKNQDTYIEKYGGDGEVRTTIIWKMFANFFEKSISDTAREMRTINSTEGGARIQGSIEMAFSEVVKLVNRENQKSPIKLREISKEEYEESLNIANQKLDKMLEIGEKSKELTEEVFLKVAETCDELEKLNEEGNLEDIDYDYLSKLLDEIDRVKALFDKDLDFVNVYFYTIQSYIVHQELELAKVRISNPKDEMGRKVKMVDWIMKHKYWLFSLAGGISATIDIIERARKNMIFNLDEEIKK